MWRKTKRKEDPKDKAYACMGLPECQTIAELKEDCQVELADLVLRPSRYFQFLRPDIQILSVPAAANVLQLYLSCNEELLNL